VSTSGTGLRLLRLGLGVIVGFLVAAGAYLAWAAWANPDVRLKQPRWVEGAFDHSYWIPVLVVTLGGAVLVALVLWKAYRRIRAGEDLYEGRLGRGLRRRGERFVDDE
jgi:H+/Cl- antiporter ClcA